MGTAAGSEEEEEEARLMAAVKDRVVEGVEVESHGTETVRVVIVPRRRRVVVWSMLGWAAGMVGWV